LKRGEREVKEKKRRGKEKEVSLASIAKLFYLSKSFSARPMKLGSFPTGGEKSSLKRKEEKGKRVLRASFRFLFFVKMKTSAESRAPCPAGGRREGEGRGFGEKKGEEKRERRGPDRSRRLALEIDSGSAGSIGVTTVCLYVGSCQRG